MPEYPVPASHSGALGFLLLPLPGQAASPFPRELLSSAPWIFLVYLAFQAHWAPWAIITLIAVLIPMVLLTARFRQV